MNTIELYRFAPSTYTQTALLVAHEVGAEAELRPLQFKEASHLALHPHGKMPALVHGEVRLYETLAIVDYLDRVFGGGLQPQDPTEHARMLQWISAAIDYGYPALVGALHDDEPASEAIVAAATQLELLSVSLRDRTWAAGNAPSLADFFAYPMVRFAVDKLGANVLDALEPLRRWYAAVADLPSARAVA